MAKSPIIWRHLDTEGEEVMWTSGWKPDSNILRWSLGAALRVEGIREGWYQSFEASENSTIWQSFVGVDEAGDDVEVDANGYTLWGEKAERVNHATLARLIIGLGDE